MQHPLPEVWFSPIGVELFVNAPIFVVSWDYEKCSFYHNDGLDTGGNDVIKTQT